MSRRTILRILIFCFSLAYSATSLAQAPELSPSVREFVSVDAPVVALRHVRVIDGTGAPAIEDQTIVIVDGKIREMGPAATTPVPENAELLDLNGHTVIPGIVGMHEHLFYPAGSTPGTVSDAGRDVPAHVPGERCHDDAHRRQHGTLPGPEHQTPNRFGPHGGA